MIDRRTAMAFLASPSSSRQVLVATGRGHDALRGWGDHRVAGDPHRHPVVVMGHADRLAR